jgi:hypothetical protein
MRQSGPQGFTAPGMAFRDGCWVSRGHGHLVVEVGEASRGVRQLALSQNSVGYFPGSADGVRVRLFPEADGSGSLL